MNEDMAAGGKSGLGDEECAAILQRIGAGEKAAALELFDRAGGLIFGLIRQVLSDPGAAEEVMLDTFTAVWNQPHLREPGSVPPLAWVLSVARTCAIERERADRRDPVAEENSAPHPAGGLLPGSDKPGSVSPDHQRLAREALDSLTLEQRRDFELAYHSGMGPGEIAARTDQSIRSVRVRIRQAMIRLSEVLQPVLGGPGRQGGDAGRLDA